MNKIKYQAICDLVKQYATEIQFVLPPLESHDQRCAPAHLWGALKDCYAGYPIKKLPDVEYQNCVDILTFVKDHPLDIRPYKQFIPKSMHRNEVYKEQCSPTLDQFLV